MKRMKTLKKKVLIPALVLAVLLLAGALGFVIYMETQYIQAAGDWVKRDSTTLDLRGKPLTAEEYGALSGELPGCTIFWDVPVENTRFPSDSRQITITRVDAALLGLLPHFSYLETVDATAVETAVELDQLRSALPDAQILWKIHLASQAFDSSEAVLDLSGTGVTAADLANNLGRFTGLRQVNLLEVSLTDSEKASLREQFPETLFVWQVQVLGKTWLSSDQELSYAGQTLDVPALVAAAPALPEVTSIDLSGCGLSLEDLTAIRNAFPNAFLRSEVTLFGKTFSTDAETLDFSGIPMESTDQVAELARLMPELKKVDMCDCGISNEEMDKLNKSFEGTQFVWRVNFSVYSLRTDATFFCASDLPGNGYVAIKMTDEQLEPLKYCTELIALDLGHMRYTDLSFLENMPKLQYLILVEARFHDISPIGTLKDLKYLEIFMNTIDDLTPLLQCKQLRHLNIGYTKGFDPEVLKQMTYLERLWYPGHGLDQKVANSIAEALPDTQVYVVKGSPDGSTGAGWREAPIYFEMRDIFSMHYMPGGTGKPDDN